MSINKIKLIKTEIDRLQSSTLDENINFKSQYDQGIFDGLSLIDNFIDSLKEPVKRTPAEIEAAMQEIEEKSKLFTEAHKDDVVSNDPISNPLEISRHGNSHIGETLEKAAGNYAFTMSGEDEVLKYYAFITGAQWQKKHLFDNRIKDYDLEEAARKIATRHSHITGDTYYANDAWFFKKGAQWQKERMLNNAMERVVKVDAGGYPYIDVTELYDYDKDRPLAKEGDKVKLIIIVEE